MDARRGGLETAFANRSGCLLNSSTYWPKSVATEMGESAQFPKDSAKLGEAIIGDS